MKDQTAKERRVLSFRFAGFEAAYGLAICFTSYLNIFLQSIGWSTTQVGILNSVNSVVSVVSTPFWGAVSDRMQSIKKVMVFLTIVTAITYFLIPYATFPLLGISALFFIIPLSQFFRAPLYILMDNWVVRACMKHGLFFGIIRSAGSLLYAVTGLALGFLVVRLNGSAGNRGILMTFPAFSLALVFMLFFVFPLKDDVGVKKEKKGLEMGKLFGNFPYIAFLIFSLLIQIPVSAIGAFMPYLLAENGIDSASFGYITGYRALLEIPIMMIFQRLRHKIPLSRMLLYSGCLYVVEAAIFGLGHGFTQIMISTTIQGIGDGFFLAITPYYVLSLAPENLRATAQTLYGSATSVSAILGNFLGGILIDIFGIRSFYLGAGCVIALSVAFYSLALKRETAINK